MLGDLEATVHACSVCDSLNETVKLNVTSDMRSVSSVERIHCMSAFRAAVCADLCMCSSSARL